NLGCQCGTDAWMPIAIAPNPGAKPDHGGHPDGIACSVQQFFEILVYLRQALPQGLVKIIEEVFDFIHDGNLAVVKGICLPEQGDVMLEPSLQVALFAGGELLFALKKSP